MTTSIKLQSLHMTMAGQFGTAPMEESNGDLLYLKMREKWELHQYSMFSLLISIYETKNETTTVERDATHRLQLKQIKNEI